MFPAFVIFFFSSFLGGGGNAPCCAAADVRASRGFFPDSWPTQLSAPSVVQRMNAQRKKNPATVEKESAPRRRIKKENNEDRKSEESERGFPFLVSAIKKRKENDIAEIGTRTEKKFDKDETKG